MTLKSKDNFVWMDLEMTGLDPERDTILEIATIITNADLELVAEGPNLIIHQPPRVLKRMDNWNQSHHGRSGLTKAVQESKLSMAQAEKETLKFIKKYCFVNAAPLCGNSIHHDRRFLAKYMPLIHRFLHYRIVDVSSIKELAKKWYPKTFESPQKTDDHRALIDIRFSIEELRGYRKSIFKKPKA